MKKILSSKPIVSILILTYEGELILEKCISSALAQNTSDFEIEVLVLDNGSTDKTSEILSGISGIKTFKNSKNQSFTKGFNRLYRESSGDFVLLLSNDVFLADNNFIVKAFNFLISNEDHGAYAPKSIKSDGSVERIPKREIYISRLFLDYTILGPIVQRLFPNMQFGLSDYSLDEDINDVDVLQDSSLFIRRSVLNPQRIFDERMAFYYTEDYLCDLIRSNGNKLCYSTETTVEHLYRFSTSKMGKVMIAYIYVKDAIFFSSNKYGKFISFIILAPLAFLTLSIRVLIWFIKGDLSWKN